jgi:hypothetical protein
MCAKSFATSAWDNMGRQFTTKYMGQNIFGPVAYLAQCGKTFRDTVHGTLLKNQIGTSTRGKEAEQCSWKVGYIKKHHKFKKFNSLFFKY